MIDRNRIRVVAFLVCLFMVIVFSMFLVSQGFVTVGFIFLTTGWFYCFLSYQIILTKRDIIDEINFTTYSQAYNSLKKLYYKRRR